MYTDSSTCDVLLVSIREYGRDGVSHVLVCTTAVWQLLIYLSFVSIRASQLDGGVRSYMDSSGTVQDPRPRAISRCRGAKHFVLITESKRI